MSNYKFNTNAIEQKISEIEATVDTSTIVDVTKFAPITLKEVIEILGLTIKKDEINKILTFLSLLSAYTEESQLNISFNAPSSSGKSYIPLEISNLFPGEDVITLGSCSPTAFYHEQGTYDKSRNTIIVDLSRKIIIFLDQPGDALLKRLRALLSHDKKEIQAKITDKNQKGGNRTKTVVIKGFPAVVFCTAGLTLDEQETTRFLLLSPEISQEKIREAINQKIEKETYIGLFNTALEGNPKRTLLKERIVAIKDEGIREIILKSPDLIKQKFLERAKILKPRHQRDIGRIISIAKTIALLNLWFRDKKGQSIVVSDDDVNEAFNLWDSISESQELNLPPYVTNFYKEVILKAFEEKNLTLGSDVPVGLTKKEITKKHYEVSGTFLSDWTLRSQILPSLETAGLITIEHDKAVDKRNILIYPTLTQSQQNNSVEDSGVTEKKEA